VNPLDGGTGRWERREEEGQKRNLLAQLLQEPCAAKNGISPLLRKVGGWRSNQPLTSLHASKKRRRPLLKKSPINTPYIFHKRSRQKKSNDMAPPQGKAHATSESFNQKNERGWGSGAEKKHSGIGVPYRDRKNALHLIYNWGGHVVGGGPPNTQHFLQDRLTTPPQKKTTNDYHPQPKTLANHSQTTPTYQRTNNHPPPKATQTGPTYPHPPTNNRPPQTIRPPTHKKTKRRTQPPNNNPTTRKPNRTTQTPLPTHPAPPPATHTQAPPKRLAAFMEIERPRVNKKTEDKGALGRTPVLDPGKSRRFQIVQE